MKTAGRSEALDLSRCDTDKIPNGYLRYYDRWFASLVDRPVRLVEIGVHRGGSLELWSGETMHAHGGKRSHVGSSASSHATAKGHGIFEFL